jgi:DNA-binding response OmpR family regulator
VNYDNITQPEEELLLAPTRWEVTAAQRILVVEDDVSVRKAIVKVLISSGYEVDFAEDGAAGWEALQAQHYDLLITDNGMPRLSGLELVKKMRTAHMTLPAILASGSVRKEELTRYPWLQIAAALQKPFAVDKLLNTVKTVLLAAGSNGDRMETIFPVRAEAIRTLRMPRFMDSPVG